ncbi:MAG TPA: hypothetical protein VL550_02290 [Rhodocyclaceae bacterium]|jgi:hypothetical protein|nr:hypothetical protein [Rhodocyclaceae bacterium]
MEIKPSLRVIEFAALLAAASVAHAADADVTSLDAAMPGASFSRTASAQRLDVFTDDNGFSLLTRDDGSLQRSLTPDDGFVALGDLAPRVFSSFTNTLVGSTYSALSRASLYVGLAASVDDGGAQVAEVDQNSTVLPLSSLSLVPANHGKTSLATAMSEPQGYAMFLAGLGIMGMVVRRRSRSF